MNYLVSFLLLVSLLFSCGTKPKNEVAALPELPVCTIEQRSAVLNTKSVAKIEAVKNVEIRSRIKGYIVEILVDEGAEVRKGQPLFKLNSPEYSAEFTKTEAALSKTIAEQRAAKMEVDRVKMLVDKNIVAPSELELSKSRFEVAQSAVAEANAILKNAKAFLSYTTITAPFDGVINRIPLKVGSLVNEGDLITSISDITAVFAYFNVSESDYLKYLRAKHTGDSLPDEENVSLFLADGSQYKYKGKIETIASEIDGATGAISFRARFANPQKLVKHGASGTISLKTTLESVILIPQKSIMEIQDKNYVFVLDQENRLSMRSILLGQRIDGNCIVLSGLKVKERIVVEGVSLVKTGDQIKPLNSHQ